VSSFVVPLYRSSLILRVCFFCGQRCVDFVSAALLILRVVIRADIRQIVLFGASVPFDTNI
jgi:hypothetical protein